MGPAKTAAARGDLARAAEHSGRAILGAETYARLSQPRREQVRVNTIRQEFTGTGMLPLPVAELEGIRIPTLLLNGECSPALFQRQIEALEETLPDVRRIVISGASHIQHEDNPAQFDAALLAFLDG